MERGGVKAQSGPACRGLTAAECGAGRDRRGHSLQRCTFLKKKSVKRIKKRGSAAFRMRWKVAAAPGPQVDSLTEGADACS